MHNDMDDKKLSTKHTGTNASVQPSNADSLGKNGVSTSVVAPIIDKFSAEEEEPVPVMFVAQRVANDEELQVKASQFKDASASAPAKALNNTGMPDSLKAGIESLGGFDMSDVKVHYNSAKPAQLQAHAYTQGTDIHIGPGQERHLPHEAWHVVKQKQGRVQPTLQMKGEVNVNDDAGLENEADVMGGKAINSSLQLWEWISSMQITDLLVFLNQYTDSAGIRSRSSIPAADDTSL